jgi:transposase
MIDFPIVELMNEQECLKWLMEHLHPEGLKCPRCGSGERRVSKRIGALDGYRCLACDRYHTIFSGTVFEKTRQRPSTIVLILRGVAKGEPTARLSRELDIGRPRLHEIRRRLQANVADTAPEGVLKEERFEADELFQNAGKKGEPHTDPADPPRRRANKRTGHGTYETDRPPIFSVVGRESGTTRYFVRERTDAETCQGVVRSTVPEGASVLYTDEWGGYARVETDLGMAHATVKHGKAGSEGREWARDDDGDGIREVHCNTCEGQGAALRTFLRPFRGVHKKFLECYVAVFEAILNLKRVTPTLVRRMCFVLHDVPSGET